jgi:site-specific DNA-adenine methylase
MRLDKFILAYDGNKYREVKKHLNLSRIIAKNYDVIAEPFCGIFGFTRAIAEINKNPDTLYYLNDINTDIINFYKNISLDLIKEYLGIIDSLPENGLSATDIADPIIKLIGRGMCISYFDKHKALQKCKHFIEHWEQWQAFFSRCRFYNLPASEFYALLPNNTFIFYDPPYFHSNCEQYIKHLDNIDGTQYYIDIYQEMKARKFDSILITNDIAIISYMYKAEFTYFIFEGRYNNSTKSRQTRSVGENNFRKNKKVHVVFDNIKKIRLKLI